MGQRRAVSKWLSRAGKRWVLDKPGPLDLGTGKGRRTIITINKILKRKNLTKTEYKRSFHLSIAYIYTHTCMGLWILFQILSCYRLLQDDKAMTLCAIHTGNYNFISNLNDGPPETFLEYLNISSNHSKDYWFYFFIYFIQFLIFHWSIIGFSMLCSIWCTATWLFYS